MTLTVVQMTKNATNILLQLMIKVNLFPAEPLIMALLLLQQKNGRLANIPTSKEGSIEISIEIRLLYSFPIKLTNFSSYLTTLHQDFAKFSQLYSLLCFC